MRLFISADIEGINGVVSHDHVMPGGSNMNVPATG